MSAQRLKDVRVLVTRPKERAHELCFLLEDEGATVLALPLLEFLPPDDPRPFRAAAEQLGRFTWVAFASPTGVQALCEAAREAGSRESLYRLKVAAVGPRTAYAAREHGLHVSVEAEATSSTGTRLVELLREVLTSDDHVLLPGAQEGRREMREGLTEAGIPFTWVAAYKSVAPQLTEDARAVLAQPPPDAVVLASPRACEALWELPEGRGQALAKAAKLVAIGPTTSAALERLDLVPASVAAVPTAEGLVDAVVHAVGRGPAPEAPEASGPVCGHRH